jgi:hypothetical protein
VTHAKLPKAFLGQYVQARSPPSNKSLDVRFQNNPYDVGVNCIAEIEVRPMNRVFTYPSIISVLILLLWSCFSPGWASAFFLLISYSFLAFLMFYDRSARPSPDPAEWTVDEIDAIRKHHFFLTTPSMARLCNANLNIFRLSVVLWIPWLFWNRVFIQAALLGLLYFVPYSLCKRLDPFNPNVGSYQQMTLASVIEKLRAKSIRVASKTASPG